MQEEEEINIEAEVKEVSPKEKSNAFLRGLRHLFGGELFIKLGERRVLKWLVITLLVGIVYIYNSYRIEKKSREIQQMQREIKKLQYEYVEMKSRLMNFSRQSSLIRELKEEGIKASKVPPRKLVKKKVNE